MNPQRILVWFRQDLRLHDNEALHYALERADEVIPVYVFDERQFLAKTSFGFPKTGKYRAKFVLEAVLDLKKSLQEKGSDLIVRIGKPEEIIFEICRDYDVSWVYCNRERTQEEVSVQNKLEEKLWGIGREINYFRGKMLYYTQDLPFPVSHTPDVFTQFRKEVEKLVRIREPLPAPTQISKLSAEIDYGQVPDLTNFGHSHFEVSDKAAFSFTGGESSGIQRLKEYIWEKDLLKSYKETRNGLLGADYSSKLSPWLAQGCISPKLIYQEIKKYEKQRVKNSSTYWLFFELLWRDFFRLMGKKHGNQIFQYGGPKQDPNRNLSDDWTKFNIWASGRTGVPFIDANMRELNETGFMSNRGRQNVASFLINDLEVNWIMGAEYFESLLLDYDPCSNYGNWNYIAGVGSDPRENRYFNIITQAKRYDPSGEYVRHWIPELQNVPDGKVHQPDTLSENELEDFGLKLGATYPKPVISSIK